MLPSLFPELTQTITSCQSLRRNSAPKKMHQQQWTGNFSSQALFKHAMYFTLISFGSSQLIHGLIQWLVNHQIFILICLQIVQKKNKQTNNPTNTALFLCLFCPQHWKWNTVIAPPPPPCNNCSTGFHQICHVRFSGLLFQTHLILFTIDTITLQKITHGKHYTEVIKHMLKM